MPIANIPNIAQELVLIPIKDDCQCWHTLVLICFSNDLEWHWLIDFNEFGISGQSHIGCQWHFPAFFFLSFCWKIYNIHFASSSLEKWPKRAEEVSSLKDDSIWKHFHDKLEPNWVFIMETKTVYKKLRFAIRIPYSIRTPTCFTIWNTQFGFDYLLWKCFQIVSSFLSYWLLLLS